MRVEVGGWAIHKKWIGQKNSTTINVPKWNVKNSTAEKKYNNILLHLTFDDTKRYRAKAAIGGTVPLFH